MSAEFNFPCSQCGNGCDVNLRDGAVAGVQCRRCGHAFSLDAEAESALLSHRPVERCVLCGCREFYVQKDFNRVIGVILVVIACILAPFTYFLSLLVVTLLDVFLFRKLSLVTVCYGCEGVYRGQPLSPEHLGFRLAIRDKYRFGKS
jgi:DNA-directed RNA polymerase subunit RPC12/RpoP